MSVRNIVIWILMKFDYFLGVLIRSSLWLEFRSRLMPGDDDTTNVVFCAIFSVIYLFCLKEKLNHFFESLKNIRFY